MRTLIPDLLYGAFLLLGGPFYLLARLLRGKPFAPPLRRLGRFPAPPPGSGPLVWVHGVSVGEVLAARGLVTALLAAREDLRIVVTTTTPAGFEAARRSYPEATISWSPLDLGFAVRRAFRAWEPSILVLVELDLWPNQLAEARRRGVPVVIANGKLSERSARGYRRLRRVLPGLLDGIARACVQNERYARRWEGLGIAEERILVTGSVKVDNVPTAADSVRGDALREAFGFAGRPVWIAGSTHPGEERAVLETHRRLRERWPALGLVLAPRHLERVPGVVEAVRASASRARRRSEGAGGEGHDVLVLDTMGELAAAFAAADVVFLGGSLAEIGGHNVLEPAAEARPIVVGPHVWTVEEQVRDLEEVGALVRVSDREGLEEALASWLGNDGARETAGRAGRALLDRWRGASERTASAVLEAMNGVGGRIDRRRGPGDGREDT